MDSESIVSIPHQTKSVEPKASKPMAKKGNGKGPKLHSQRNNKFKGKLKGQKKGKGKGKPAPKTQIKSGDDLGDDFLMEDETEEKTVKSDKATSKTNQKKKKSNQMESMDHLSAPQRYEMAIKSALGKDATEIELADYSLDPSVFAEWSGEKNLESLSEAIRKNIEDFNTRANSLHKGKPGSPLALVVCAAGMRSADVVRGLRGLSKAPVAKLFAKHFKVEEQVQFLSKSKPVVAVGTPARLEALLDANALKLDSCQLLIVDASHRDVKQRSIVENTKTELVSFIKRMLPKLKSQEFKVLWY